VSKEEFTVAADSPKAEHGGKTYYFCCAGCDTKFSKDPAKYLGK
jgi:YHS domain-containing protein